jgi:hypothetical protein
MTRTQERETSTAYEQTSLRDAAHVAIRVQAPDLARGSVSSGKHRELLIIERNLREDRSKEGEREKECVSRKPGEFDCCPSNDSTRQEALIRQCTGTPHSHSKSDQETT